MYDRLIHQGPDFQWRLTVSEFHGQEYLHIRKYFLDFEENWVPTKDGFSMPLDLNNIRELFVGLLEILSLGESQADIQKYFGALLKDIYV